MHCSFSASNKITLKGCQSASQTCDFDAKMQKKFLGRGHSLLPDPSPSEEGGHPLPTPHPSILTPPILKLCLRYKHHSFELLNSHRYRRPTVATFLRCCWKYEVCTLVLLEMILFLFPAAGSEQILKIR